MKPDHIAAEDYRNAFVALGREMTRTRRELLRRHYRAYHHQATMSQIAEAMGWRSYSSANSHYGRLARLVSEKAGFAISGCHLNALCTFIEPQKPGDHWLIIMRPAVARALEELGWV